MRTSSLQAAPFGGDPRSERDSTWLGLYLAGGGWLLCSPSPSLGPRAFPPIHTRPTTTTTSTQDPQAIEASDQSNGVTFPQLALCLPNPAGGILSACNFQPP